MEHRTDSSIDNPYVGPQPFEPEQSHLFFGREREARDLLAKVISERLTVFFAQSGAGKSSLLNTRIIPQLRESGFLVLPIGRIGGETLTVPTTPAATTESVEQPAINVFVSRLLLSLDQQYDDETDQRDPRRFDGMTIGEFASKLTTADGISYHYDKSRTLTSSTPAADQPPHILIIDQFEEIISTHQDRWQDREGFFEQLADLMRDDPKLWVLLTLREDYVATLEPYAELFPGRMTNRYYMQRLEKQGALQAIVEPAKLGRHPFSDGVAEKLVDDLQQIRVQGQEDTRTGQFVEPVQLQVVCHQLWNKINNNPIDAEITVDDLDEANVDTALTQFYEEAIAAVVDMTGTPELLIRRWFNKELITETATRGTVYQNPDISTEQGELKQGRTGSSDYGLYGGVINQLAKRYLIRSETRAGGRWYELVHDRLIPPILTANRRWQVAWLQDNLIMQRAKDWEVSNRGQTRLLKGKLLNDALEIMELGKLDPSITAFLASSKEEAEKRSVLDRAGDTFALADRQTVSGQGSSRELSEVGWGVIFPADPDGTFVPAIKEALAELLELRQEQAGERFRIFEGADAPRSGESVFDFLVRNGTTVGAPDYHKVPYYLLLVGDPEQLPWRFQTGLALDFAVGRVQFETLEEYANYARSVVTVERMPPALPRQVALFSPVNPDDRMTELATTGLTEPIRDWLNANRSEWEISACFREQATKAQLARFLGGDQTPGFLWVSSHSMPFGAESPLQVAYQGALLCQDWPGARAWRGRGVIPESFYFSGSDLASDANLLGLIAFFHTACGAGTPSHDDFPKPGSTSAKQIAPKPFVARLPMQMLGHGKGGALAVVSQIGMNFGSGFFWRPDIVRLTHHYSFIERVLDGHTIGAAMDAYRHDYASWGAMLSTVLRDVQFGRQVEPYNLSAMWTAFGNARNLSVIGDPAVRLIVGEQPASTIVRPTIVRPTPKASSAVAKEAASNGEELLYFNGINAETGEYDLDPMTAARLFDVLRGVAEPDNIRELEYRVQQDTEEHL